MSAVFGGALRFLIMLLPLLILSALLLAVAFFSGIQLLTLGIIGEYLGRLYMEVKGRPLFMIERRTGWSVQDEAEGSAERTTAE